MASLNTLEILRTQLVKDIVQAQCEPCVNSRKKKYAFNPIDPLIGSCRCEAVVPLMQRLEELENALDISASYLR